MRVPRYWRAAISNVPEPTLMRSLFETMVERKSSVVPEATLMRPGAVAVSTLPEPATVVLLLMRKLVPLMISVMKLFVGMFVPVTS